MIKIRLDCNNVLAIVICIYNICGQKFFIPMKAIILYFSEFFCAFVYAHTHTGTPKGPFPCKEIDIQLSEAVY